MTYIYKTLTATDIAQALLQDEYAGWSYNGATALADYLIELAEETGSPIQLDVVALRCEFSEYKNLAAFNIAQGSDHETLDKLHDHNTVLEFDGGIIVADF
jgi:hypothetical protein